MKKNVCGYLIWPPFTAIWITHVTEQVLKQPPSGVASLEPYIDCEGYRAAV